MTRRGDGVVGCMGVCKMKDMNLFEDRRGGRRTSVIPALPPIRFKGMSVDEQRKLDERLRDKRNQGPLPLHRGIPVKRMRKRRERAKFFGEQGSADVCLKLQEESDDTEAENSGPQVTQMVYVICRILFVIIGLGVLIYGSVLLISMIPADAINKLNKSNEPVQPVKLTFKEWEEKRSRENHVQKE